MRSTSSAAQRYLKRRAAAKYLGMCERTLWQRERDGLIRSIKEGRSVKFDVAELDAYMAARAKPNNAGEAIT